MPSFKGTGEIVIQPSDVGVIYSFGFSASTSATANDGSIPYGTSISSVVVAAFKETATRTTDTDLVTSSSVTSNVVSVVLKWPTTNGAGLYTLRFFCTLSDGEKIEYDFGRVIARDL